MLLFTLKWFLFCLIGLDLLCQVFFSLYFLGEKVADLLFYIVFFFFQKRKEASKNSTPIKRSLFKVYEHFKKMLLSSLKRYENPMIYPSR